MMKIVFFHHNPPPPSPIPTFFTFPMNCSFLLENVQFSRNEALGVYVPKELQVGPLTPQVFNEGILNAEKMKS